MTPEQQRIKLAEWDGWTKIGMYPHPIEGISDVFAGIPDGNTFPQAVPNYLSDLNAVHLLERKLNLNQLGQYADELDKVCVEVHICPLTHWSAVTCATAAQRCEAMLKTLGLWEETK